MVTDENSQANEYRIIMHQTSSQDFKNYGYAANETTGEKLNADIKDDFMRESDTMAAKGGGGPGYTSLGGGIKNLVKPSSAAPSRKPI